jgi:hypothetical protein
MVENINLEDWYSASEAADRLSRNSGKTISVDYARDLARQNKIKSVNIGARGKLYLKADVDAYIVEERGTKSGRAKRVAAANKQSKQSK